jgi:hypothetical protein
MIGAIKTEQRKVSHYLSCCDCFLHLKFVLFDDRFASLSDLVADSLAVLQALFGFGKACFCTGGLFLQLGVLGLTLSKLHFDFVKLDFVPVKVVQETKDIHVHFVKIDTLRFHKLAHASIDRIKTCTSALVDALEGTVFGENCDNWGLGAVENFVLLSSNRSHVHTVAGEYTRRDGQFILVVPECGSVDTYTILELRRRFGCPFLLGPRGALEILFRFNEEQHRLVANALLDAIEICKSPLQARRFGTRFST